MTQFQQGTTVGVQRQKGVDMTTLKKGQRVKLNLEGTVHEAGKDWVRVTLADGIETVYLDIDDINLSQTLEVVPDPLPTEPGFYAHRNSFSEVQASATILQLNHAGIWANRTDSSGFDGLQLARLWHDAGLLVKLGVEE